MDETVQTPDAPVAAPPEPVSAPAPTAPDEPTTTPEQPQVPPAEPTETPEVPPAPDQPAAEVDEFEYPKFQVPQTQPIDFSNLPVGDDNLIDPNALAGTINQALAQNREAARIEAQQAYQEQRTEERSWEKAYEKYPELKTNKETRDFIHNARLGEVNTALSRATTREEAEAIKLPTPTQMADRLFKLTGTAKKEGMQQANENTVIQESARLETSGTTGSDDADAKQKAFQNINNPNTEVAKKARQDVLKGMLGW